MPFPRDLKRRVGANRPYLFLRMRAVVFLHFSKMCFQLTDHVLRIIKARDAGIRIKEHCFRKEFFDEAAAGGLAGGDTTAESYDMESGLHQIGRGALFLHDTTKTLIGHKMQKNHLSKADITTPALWPLCILWLKSAMKKLSCRLIFRDLRKTDAFLLQNTEKYREIQRKPRLRKRGRGLNEYFLQ